MRRLYRNVPDCISELEHCRTVFVVQYHPVMGRSTNPVVNWSQYLAARWASMTLTMFNCRANLQTAAMIGHVLHSIDKRHRGRAARHISLCFPEMKKSDVDDLVLKSFEHFVQLVVEILHTPTMMTRDGWPSRTELENLGDALDLLNQKKPALLVTGHLGNWEVLGYFMALMGYHLEALARPIDNPLVNDWLLGIRERQGLKIITKWNATDRMIDVLDQGGSLGFIADQNAGDKGLFVPFFGKLASSYKSIGLLAMQKNVPIICGYASRFGKDYTYRLGAADIIYPDDWQQHPDPLFYITARYNRAMETMIRRSPSQYLWMHRRWKSRPRHERAGKPMPKKLRANIEALPWMDQPTLDRLLTPFPWDPKMR